MPLKSPDAHLLTTNKEKTFLDLLTARSSVRGFSEATAMLTLEPDFSFDLTSLLRLSLARLA